MSDSAIFHSQSSETSSEILTERSGSDNVCIDNLSNLETQGLSNRTTCGACGRRFYPDCPGQKFCDKACYHSSLRVDLESRFWTKVDRRGPDDCWLWIAQARIGQKGKFPGYGSISGTVNGKKRPLYSNRVAWELTNGPIPDGLFVLHTCDVSLCCNPRHLFLGTQQTNLNDAREKGRLDESRPRRATLTPADREAIYAMPRRRGLATELARQYGVTKACISRVLCGRFARMDNVSGPVRMVPLPVRGELHVGSLAERASTNPHNSVAERA